MTSPKERDEILEMVAAGTVSAGEAIRLLSGAGKPPVEAADAAEVPAAETTLEAEHTKEGAAASRPVGETTTEAEVTKQDAAASGSAASPGWLKVRVSGRDGRDRVRVNIPLRVVRLGMRLGAGFVPELRRQEWDDLDEMLAHGGAGLLVDVQDEERGEHVQVYVE